MASIAPTLISRVARACRSDLRQWYRDHARPLPWRLTSDPYAIWISEAMLQQTRVDQAIDYYDRFLQRFPTLRMLAAASVDDVLRVWEGLGYYARARNLLKGAKKAHETYGQVPGDYSSLLDLPGIGPYSAAAIASIAFGHPYAVLDGNVIRVLARLFAVRKDTRLSSTGDQLRFLAEAILPADQPGIHNQAIMELGATVCRSRNPSCPVCPLSTCCVAFEKAETAALPVRSRKSPIPHYNVVVGLFRDSEDRYLITRRPDEAMLGGLWEFPGGKQENGEDLETALKREMEEELGINIQVNGQVFDTKQTYTHFRITLFAFICKIISGVPTPRNGMPLEWVDSKAMSNYAFPRANRKLINHLQKLNASSDRTSVV